MAGYTIIGYLLLQDAQKCDKYVKSAEIFINYGKAKVAAHDEMINSFNPDKLGIYKKNYNIFIDTICFNIFSSCMFFTK